jgi:hypothetical protein
MAVAPLNVREGLDSTMMAARNAAAVTGDLEMALLICRAADTASQMAGWMVCQATVERGEFIPRDSVGLRPSGLKWGEAEILLRSCKDTG